MTNKVLEERARAYADRKAIELDYKRRLGFGQDGSVWRSNRKTAVKALERARNYEIELECYQRFARYKVSRLHGFAIPQLIDYDDELQVIEMRIVTAPYLLDFAKSWLDAPADYSDEAMNDWQDQGQELFGERWKEVQTVISSLAKYGIYYYDAKPANIRFREEDETS